MNILEVIKSGASVQMKYDAIRDCPTSDLLKIDEKCISRLIREQSHSNNFMLNVGNDERVGNGWDSLVCGVYVANSGRVFVDVYIQNTQTDTNMSIDYRKFFDRVGCTFDCRELGRSVRYSAKELGEVMRSFLRCYVRRVYGIGISCIKDKASAMKMLRPIITEVVNHYYKKLRVDKIQMFGSPTKKYSTDEVCRMRGYHAGEKRVNECAEREWLQLSKDKVKAKERFMSVFETAYNAFRKDFYASE